MLTYEQALAQIASRVTRLEPISLPLHNALGLALAEDIITPINLPPFANSSMDGYAARAADVRSVPTTLPVIGEIPAGAIFTSDLAPGTAVRIMTGAPLPEGADAVIPVEETKLRGSRVAFLATAEPGQCIRPAGEDVTAGSVVVNKGSRLRPAEIGMCAAVGRSTVRVYPRPRVAIISTGDELIEPGEPLQGGQIYNSNAYSLAAQVEEAGGVVTHRLLARDNADALRTAFDESRGADVLLTSGGVSVGDYDHVKHVFAEHGTVDFWRVAIRPGKPLVFGHRDNTFFFGLPGNPVSSFVTFELFVRPALRRMLGYEDLTRTMVQAQLTEEASHNSGRQSFLRAIATPIGNGYTVRPLPQQGSGMLRSLVLANSLLVLPAEAAGLPAGASATVLLLG